jgi:hypothetical protein
MRKTRLVPVIGVALAVAAGPLHAQVDGARSDNWSAPGWMGDVTFLSLNALTSGVTAGVFQKLRGESFTDAFARGALGGAVYYGGLRISAQHFDGAGLLGRQVAATGTSMVRNASDGRPALERLFVPLGPLHLYVDLADGVAVRPKVNLATLATLVAAVAEPVLEWDARATLSAGAPVFRAPGRGLISDGVTWRGYVAFGSIFLGELSSADMEPVFAHERAHVLQGDWLFLAWSDPMESWVLNRVPLGSTLHRYADFDLAARALHWGAYELFNVSDENRLHEIEAGFLAERQ